MADIKQKIESINSRISDCDEKMKKILLQKKDFERQKKELQEQEIISAVKSNKIDIDTLRDDLAFVRLLQEHNFDKDDILSLISSDTNGGFLNENK